jgi:hypothetical protein
MRFFALLNLEDIALYLFPALVFVLLFASALAFSHFRTEDSEERRTKSIRFYPEGLESKTAPFPLFLTLTIVGTALWAIFYTLAIGLGGIKI